MILDAIVAGTDCGADTAALPPLDWGYGDDTSGAALPLCRRGAALFGPLNAVLGGVCIASGRACPPVIPGIEFGGCTEAGTSCCPLVAAGAGDPTLIGVAAAAAADRSAISAGDAAFVAIGGRFEWTSLIC